VLWRCHYADAATVDRSTTSIAVQTEAVSANSGVSGDISEEQPVGGRPLLPPLPLTAEHGFEETKTFGLWRKRGVTRRALWARLSRERDFKVYYIPLHQAAAITGAGAPPSCA
jgi:hypothetical protein